MCWNTPLVRWGQLSWLCPLPILCAPPVCLLEEWGEKQKRSGHCVSAAQQLQNQLCVSAQTQNLTPCYENKAYPRQNQHKTNVLVIRQKTTYRETTIKLCFRKMNCSVHHVFYWSHKIVNEHTWKNCYINLFSAFHYISFLWHVFLETQEPPKEPICWGWKLLLDGMHLLWSPWCVASVQQWESTGV